MAKHNKDLSIWSCEYHATRKVYLKVHFENTKANDIRVR